MRLIIKIAKNELLYLFYSPVAWFVMIVFVIQCGLFYFETLIYTAEVQDMLLKNSPGFKDHGISLTASIFTRGDLFPNLYQNLYLFVPLLTMGLVSKEVNSGSIKLIYSSPIKISQLVLGKYLGIMIFNLVLTCMLFLIVISGMFNIKEVDLGPLLSATVGFYLLAAAYSAVGLFMSSVTTNTIIAGLSIFLILFILTFIGDLWQQYNFIRDLSYFLSMEQRAYDLSQGLISSKDLIYFTAIAALFVTFAYLQLRSRPANWNWYTKAGKFIAVLGGVLAIGYLSSRPGFTKYWDVSARKTNTIHAKSQQAITQLGDVPLEITLYVNLFNNEMLKYGLPQNRNNKFLKFWSRYTRFKPDIKFNYVYFYYKDLNGSDSVFIQGLTSSGKTLKQMARDMAESLGYNFEMFKSPEEISDRIKKNSEQCVLLMDFTYKGHTEMLRAYDIPQTSEISFPPTETNIYATLHRLTVTAPSIYFTSGHLERRIHGDGDRDFRHLAWTRAGLANIGFDVDTINLKTQEIPANASILAIGDPKIPFESGELEKVKAYVASGRNLIVLGHPKKQYLINPFLQSLGVQLLPGQLVMPTWDETPEKVLSYIPGSADGLVEELNGVKRHLDGGDTVLLLRGTPNTTGVVSIGDSVNANQFRPILMSVPGTTWLKAGEIVFDSTLPPINPAEGDRKVASFTTAAAITRKVNGKEQRIILSGGADLFSLKSIQGDNRQTSHNFFKWLDYGRNPVFMQLTRPKDTLLNISGPAALAQRIAYMWVFPAMLLIGGTLLIVRRKRR